MQVHIHRIWYVFSPQSSASPLIWWNNTSACGCGSSMFDACAEDIPFPITSPLVASEPPSNLSTKLMGMLLYCRIRYATSVSTLNCRPPRLNFKVHLPSSWTDIFSTFEAKTETIPSRLWSGSLEVVAGLKETSLVLSLREICWRAWRKVRRETASSNFWSPIDCFSSV